MAGVFISNNPLVVIDELGILARKFFFGKETQMSLKTLVAIVLSQSFGFHAVRVSEAAPIADSTDTGGYWPPHTNHLRKAQRKVTPTKPHYWATGPPALSIDGAFSFYASLTPLL